MSYLCKRIGIYIYI